MVILSAIGRFFKKIWDWIKQTAWIQPLLIVGIIFGVIFSIPSIVNAVKSNKKDKATYKAYFHNYQYSLELTEDYEGKRVSKADVFTYKLGDVLASKAGAEEAFKSAYPDLGDKFFVAYVGTKCTDCEAAKPGFSTFEAKLNKDAAFYTADRNEKFHMVTIFADEETSETEENKTAFVHYLSRHEDFFADAGAVAYETAYYTKGHLTDIDLEYLETADPDNFLTPTIMLVELGNKASENHNEPGVTEIMFGVTGNTKNEKAKTLLDCWKHEGEFSLEKK